MSIINKRGLVWVLSCVFVWSSCIYGDVNAGEKTEQAYWDGTNTTLVVQKTAAGLSVHFKAKDGGEFTSSILTSQFDTGIVSIKFIQGGPTLQISRDGDVIISKTQGRKFVDLSAWGKFGIRTPGKVEISANLGLRSLVAISHSEIQINGELRTAEPSQFFIGRNSRLCNNGRLLLSVGEAASRAEGNWLQAPARPIPPAPHYGGLVTSGSLKVGGMLQIRGGLSLHQNRGESILNNLDMSGGDIRVADNAKMALSAALKGTVGNIHIGENADLEVGTVDLLGPIKNLDIKEGGQFNIKHSSEVKVSGNFTISGRMASAEDLTLSLKHAPTVLPGRVESKGSLRVQSAPHPDKHCL